ncbi:bifunctional lytic transglycosylase/C40 family peptidase [Bacillus licheniformis]|nr:MULTISPECIES: bifunctional lytic transglycosylase/C40 family peptidase [Bacillus subtilis group]ASK26302.1 peptidase [Bacillus subtilis]TWK70912.1 Peptidoglycan DL-endopeptidase CwlO [Bacillus licheniformis]
MENSSGAAVQHAKEMAKAYIKKVVLRVILSTLFSSVGLILIGVLIICFAIVAVVNEKNNSMEFGTGGVYEVNISEIGANEIPAEFVDIYKRAGEKYGIPWTLLAAEHRVETTFSSNLSDSSVGAVGHFQFMPKTWIGWGYPGGNRVGNLDIPKDKLTDPKLIKKYGGYGVDANNDGKADPWDLEDAAFSAAKYLRDNGGAQGDFRSAVYAYNHADWYVEEVLSYFNKYTAGYKLISVNEGANIAKGGNKAIEKAIAAGSTLVGKSPYNWGGGRTTSDILRHSFDCSSFVRWAYEQGGVNLGPMASTTTDTLVRQGKAVSSMSMKRGDLLFFDTYKRNGHVGIYLGNGQFLNDNSSHGVSIDSLNNSYWKAAFKGVVRRVVQ